MLHELVHEAVHLQNISNVASHSWRCDHTVALVQLDLHCVVVQAPCLSTDGSSWVVLLEHAFGLFLMHSLSYRECQHISDSDGNSRGSGGCTDAEGDLFQFVDRRREQDSVRAFAQKRALRGCVWEVTAMIGVCEGMWSSRAMSSPVLPEYEINMIASFCFMLTNMSARCLMPSTGMQ